MNHIQDQQEVALSIPEINFEDRTMVHTFASRISNALVRASDLHARVAELERQMDELRANAVDAITRQQIAEKAFETVNHQRIEAERMNAELQDNVRRMEHERVEEQAVVEKLRFERDGLRADLANDQAQAQRDHEEIAELRQRIVSLEAAAKNSENIAHDAARRQQEAEELYEKSEATLGEVKIRLAAETAKLAAQEGTIRALDTENKKLKGLVLSIGSVLKAGAANIEAEANPTHPANSHLDESPHLFQ